MHFLAPYQDASTPNLGFLPQIIKGIWPGYKSVTDGIKQTYSPPNWSLTGRGLIIQFSLHMCVMVAMSVALHLMTILSSSTWLQIDWSPFNSLSAY